jgi:hypothetical protein
MQVKIFSTILVAYGTITLYNEFKNPFMLILMVVSIGLSSWMIIKDMARQK